MQHITYPTVTDPLEPSDLQEPFQCSDQAAVAYLAGASLTQHVADLGRTWVLRRTADDPPTLPAVLGYYTLATGSMEVVRPNSWRSVDLLPVLSIAHFAVSTAIEGRGFGQHLLLDALTRAVMVADQVGAMGVVATARSDRALRWCSAHGFVELTARPVRRVLMPMRLARRAVRSVFED